MKMSVRYLYLNRGGRWPGFEREQLESSEDGALTPAALPSPRAGSPPTCPAPRPAADGTWPPLAPPSPMPAALAARPAADGGSGLAVGPGGDLWWTDPPRALLFRRDACDGTIEQVACFGGEGPGLSQFRHPRGLLYHPGLARLLVCDSGNARIALIDTLSRQLTGFWGRGDGMFKDPRGMARDSSGYTYVADRGHGLIKKISPRGVEVASFSEAQRGHLWHPADLAVARGPSGLEQVFAIDDRAHILRILSLDGASLPVVDLTGNGWPIGLAVEDGGLIHVGDGYRSRIQKFRMRSSCASELEGDAHYHGPTAALALDGKGGLVVLPDASGPIVLALDGGRAPVGRLMGGPFPDPTLAIESWHRLRAEGPPVPAGSAVTLYVRRRPRGPGRPAPPWRPGPGNPPPVGLPPAQVASPPAPLVSDLWYRVAEGARECLFPGAPGDDLWVAAELAGDGATAPTLTQLRIDFQYEALAHRLPDCYFDDVPGRGFATRLVGLFAGLFEDCSDAIERLPSRFDPEAAPARDLANLAGLVGLETRPDMPEARLREAIAGVPALTASRGLSAGLAAALSRDLGVCAWIDEPIRQAVAWVLAGDCGPGDAPDGSRGVGSVLGVTTALSAGEPQGAVLGSTSTLDHTQLIADEDVGLPIFGELAHRVTVRARRPPGAGPGWLRAVREVVDRELPCHVEALICALEPELKLGFQARLGVDAILGGPVAPGPLDSVAPGASPVLAGLLPARLGASTLGGAPLALGFAPMRIPPSPETLS